MFCKIIQDIKFMNGGYLLSNIGNVEAVKQKKDVFDYIKFLFQIFEWQVIQNKISSQKHTFKTNHNR